MDLVVDNLLQRFTFPPTQFLFPYCLERDALLSSVFSIAKYKYMKILDEVFQILGIIIGEVNVNVVAPMLKGEASLPFSRG